MSNTCALSPTVVDTRAINYASKVSKIGLNQLPFEIILMILDHLVIATDSIPPHTDIDLFIQGCSGSRKPIYHRMYNKNFISLLAVNRLFYELVTHKIYKNMILSLSDQTPIISNRESSVCTKSESNPFVFHGGSTFEEFDVTLSERYWYSTGTLTTFILKKVQSLCITAQDRWYYEPVTSQLLNWSTLSAATNLKFLTIDTKVFSFIYNEHYNSPFLGNEEDNYWSIYEKLLSIKKEGSDNYLIQDFDRVMSKASTPRDIVAYKLQQLSDTFAKIVVNQTHKITCTFIHNYHRLPNFSSLIWAFEKYKTLDTVETLVIQNSIRGISSFLFVSHLALLKNLKRFCFDSYMNFESSLFTILEKLEFLEQLLFDTSFTSLPTEPFRLPHKLQKLVITEKIFFHNQLKLQPKSLENLVELHLNFRSGYYNTDLWYQDILDKLKLAGLKTLVAKGETQDNMLLLSNIISLNPGITTFSLSIPSFYRNKIGDILTAMKNIECFSIYFGPTMSDPRENIESSSLISNTLASLPSLKNLLLDSGDLSLSLRRVLKDISFIHAEKCPNLEAMTIYHTNYSSAVGSSTDVMDCFEETVSKNNSIISGIDLSKFMKITDILPSSEVKSNEFPLCKLDINVKRLREALEDNKFNTLYHFLCK